MRTSHRTGLTAAVCLLIVRVNTNAPVSGAEFETPGPLRSERYLRPDQLAGPEWRVEPEAANDGLMNTYTITSRFGNWPARGGAQVGVRIHEIEALARLEEVSKLEVFLDAVENSVTAPFKLVRDAARQPEETIKGIPEGVGRWFKKTTFKAREGYDDVKDKVREAREERARRGESAGSEPDSDTESQSLREKIVEEVKEEASEEGRDYALKYLKISSAERSWYRRLGVDPYTDNELLREGIESVARVEGLTNFGMKFAGLPAIPGAGEIRRTMDLVWKTDPWELRRRNRKLLVGAGLSVDTARLFEENRAMGLTLQTAFLDILGQLEGVAGREHLIARAIDLDSREDAHILVASTALLLRFHRQEESLRAFLGGARLPVARTVGGDLVAVLIADAAFWTVDVAEEVKGFATTYAGEPAGTRQLLLVGEASPGFERGVRELGWVVRDRWHLAAPEDAPASSGGP